MESVEVTDLYQASYYLLSGCEITGVECRQAGTGSSCRLTVQGPNLAELASAWFERQAVVNLWTFRNAYTEINSHVQQAKRSFELSLRYRRDEA